MSDSREELQNDWGGSPIVLQQLLASGWLSEIVWRDEVDSTNTLAKSLIMKQAIRSPGLIVTRLQTAGRGRLNRSWFADEGTLTFSIVLADHHLQTERSRWPQLAVVAGLATCDVLSPIVTPANASLKWPNDVYINDGKVAGILIETAGSDDHVVVGIGINMATEISAGPEEIQNKAKSVSQIVGHRLSAQEILPDLIDRFRARLLSWQHGFADSASDFRKVCLLSHRRVTIRAGENIIEGHCKGISDEGDLVVDTNTGLKAIRSGEVSAWGELD